MEKQRKRKEIQSTKVCLFLNEVQCTSFFLYLELLLLHSFLSILLSHLCDHLLDQMHQLLHCCPHDTLYNNLLILICTHGLHTSHHNPFQEVPHHAQFLLCHQDLPVIICQIIKFLKTCITTLIFKTIMSL